jgi:hypothetical protein
MADPFSREAAFTGVGPMTINLSELAEFGWNSYFTSQLEPDDFDNLVPARVIAVHRNALEIAAANFAASIPPFSSHDGEGEWRQSATGC